MADLKPINPDDLRYILAQQKANDILGIGLSSKLYMFRWEQGREHSAPRVRKDEATHTNVISDTYQGVNDVECSVNGAILHCNEVVPVGSSRAFSGTFAAPPVPGSYAFQWQMVEEGAEGFGATGDLDEPNDHRGCHGQRP